MGMVSCRNRPCVSDTTYFTCWQAFWFDRPSLKVRRPRLCLAAFGSTRRARRRPVSMYVVGICSSSVRLFSFRHSSSALSGRMETNVGVSPWPTAILVPERRAPSGGRPWAMPSALLPSFSRRRRRDPTTRTVFRTSAATFVMNTAHVGPKAPGPMTQTR